MAQSCGVNSSSCGTTESSGAGVLRTVTAAVGRAPSTTVYVPLAPSITFSSLGCTVTERTSSSLIVPVATAAASVAPCGSLSRIVKLSAPSATASSVTATPMVRAAGEAAGKVSVPLTAA